MAGGKERHNGAEVVSIFPQFFLIYGVKNYRAGRFRKDLLKIYFKNKKYVPKEAQGFSKEL